MYLNLSFLFCFLFSVVRLLYLPHLRSWVFCSGTRTGWRGRCPGCPPRWWRSARWPAQWTLQKTRLPRSRSRSGRNSSTCSHAGAPDPSPFTVQRSYLGGRVIRWSAKQKDISTAAEAFRLGSREAGCGTFKGSSPHSSSVRAEVRKERRRGERGPPRCRARTERPQMCEGKSRGEKGDRSCAILRSQRGSPCAPLHAATARLGGMCVRSCA